MMADHDPEIEDQQLWPCCSRCGVIAKPGVRCDRERCPFTRIEGVIGWKTQS